MSPPTAKNTPAGIAAAHEIGKLLNFHTVVELDPRTHDEMIAFVSQLTHAIAVSLMTCNDDQNLQNYTGDSFRDLTPHCAHQRDDVERIVFAQPRATDRADRLFYG